MDKELMYNYWENYTGKTSEYPPCFELNQSQRRQQDEKSEKIVTELNLRLQFRVLLKHNFMSIKLGSSINVSLIKY